MTQLKWKCLYGSFRIALFSTTALTLLIILNYGVLPKEKGRYSVFAAVSFRELNTLQNREDKHISTDLLQYKPPPFANVTKVGKRFNVDLALMKSLGMPFTNFVALSRNNVEKFVFVIGASSNHIKESIDAIASVQKFMPAYKIIYYDLGLSKAEIKQVKSFCNVEYRKFNSSIYPEHVKDLHTYAFKPVIVTEVLSTNPGVFWMDASVRLFNNFTSIYSQILDTDGYLQFWHSPHSNGAVTHPGQYLYIPTNETRQEDVPSRGAAAVMFYRTKSTYWSFFHWWVMCALDKDCISPKGSTLSCDFNRYGIRKYAHCHRYDQSALNLLASNLYGYDANRYTATDRGVVKLMKHITSLYDVQICPAKV